jgi:hypothetical protein
LAQPAPVTSNLSARYFLQSEAHLIYVRAVLGIILITGEVHAWLLRMKIRSGASLAVSERT